MQPEPPIGHIQTAADGSRWRKVRTLGQQAYADALVDALFNARFGHPVTTAHLEAMGYRQVPP